MNPSIERFGPPALVLSIALYLGWAPSAPLDLGDDLVRAKAVRWKQTDLVSPHSIDIAGRNPFAPVLKKPEQHLAIADASMVATKNDSAVLEPIIGLTENDLMIGLKLTGIAQTDQRHWAIINGRIVSAGDRISITGQRDKTALITKVTSDVVIATADSVTVHLKKTRRSERSPLAAEGREDRVSAPRQFPALGAVKAAFDAVAIPALASKPKPATTTQRRLPGQSLPDRP